MRKLLVLAGSVLAVCFFAGSGAQAAFVPAFCTGTITTVASGGFIPGSTLVIQPGNPGAGGSTGNCVEAADKIFGDFTVGGSITGAGSAGWQFTMATGPADVTIGFQGSVTSGQTGSEGPTVRNRTVAYCTQY
jgi:hypothetical protein